MKIITASLMALAAASPALFAQYPAAPQPAPAQPMQAQGNCDLLASNTVRATYVGVQEIQKQGTNEVAPSTAHVAVFEVVENCGYSQYMSYGDPQLQPGSRFTVALSREVPGQPADIVDTIFAMQPGEEALMKIDHIFIYGGQSGTSLRPCSRMLRRAAAAGTPGASAPTTITPPQVVQPIPTPAPTPAPIPEPDSQRSDDSDDDTTIEHAPQNDAPIPSPIVPETGAAGDSF